jgi:hypothetical protein
MLLSLIKSDVLDFRQDGVVMLAQFGRGAPEAARAR